MIKEMLVKVGWAHSEDANKKRPSFEPGRFQKLMLENFVYSTVSTKSPGL